MSVTTQCLCVFAWSCLVFNNSGKLYCLMILHLASQHQARSISDLSFCQISAQLANNYTSYICRNMTELEQMACIWSYLPYTVHLSLKNYIGQTTCTFCQDSIIRGKSCVSVQCSQVGQDFLILFSNSVMLLLHATPLEQYSSGLWQFVSLQQGHSSSVAPLCEHCHLCSLEHLAKL